MENLYTVIIKSIPKIIAWFDDNKEWLFSGLGLSVLGVGYRIWNKCKEKCNSHKVTEKKLSKGVENKKEELSSGSSYYFGRIPDTENSLEWIVVQRKNNELLLLCKNIICEKEYDIIDNRNWKTRDEEMSWSSSSLNYYLNGSFFTKAFDSSERDRIICKNNDYVLLLNQLEVANLPIEIRICKNIMGITKEWWVNTSGCYRSDNIMYVAADGNINAIGYNSEKKVGVRPALWIRV